MSTCEWIEVYGERIGDVLNCAMELQELLDKAKKFVMSHDGGWASFNISPDTLIETGLVWAPEAVSVGAWTKIADLDGQELRGKWSRVVQWFEDFDEERRLKTQGNLKVDLADGLRWGFWRQSRGGYCGLDGIAEEGFKVQTYVDKKSNVPVWGTRHGYNSDNIPKVTFKLWSFQQTGLRYFVGSGSFCEIDAVSRVPSYPSNISDSEWGERSLSPDDSDEEFQRPLSLERQQDISAFVDERENRILNSIMVYLPEAAIKRGEANLVHAGGDEWELEIDLANFLVQGEKGLMWDHENDRDLRPLLIQDGQHRVRGGAISATGQHKRVPLVILPPEMSLSDAARTFTEINTGSEELKVLQKLHLRHRFKLSSMKKKLDFRDYREMEPGNHRRGVCRANRLAYETVALLSCDPASAISDRIRMMDKGSGASSVCSKANKFTEIASGWFSEGSVFGKEVQ